MHKFQTDWTNPNLSEHTSWLTIVMSDKFKDVDFVTHNVPWAKRVFSESKFKDFLNHLMWSLSGYHYCYIEFHISLGIIILAEHWGYYGWAQIRNCFYDDLQNQFWSGVLFSLEDENHKKAEIILDLFFNKMPNKKTLHEKYVEAIKAWEFEKAGKLITRQAFRLATKKESWYEVEAEELREHAEDLLSYRKWSDEQINELVRLLKIAVWVEEQNEQLLKSNIELSKRNKELRQKKRYIVASCLC